jgi:hypothetical protein
MLLAYPANSLVTPPGPGPGSSQDRAMPIAKKMVTRLSTALTPGTELALPHDG